MRATTQLLTLSPLLALLFCLTLLHQADAAPFRPRPYSESARLAAKDECRLGGGAEFETVYHYDFGSSTPTSATTTCHGGANDGQTCEISGSGKQCGMPLRAAGDPLGAPSSMGVIERLGASQPSSTTHAAGGVLATTALAEDDDRP